jgi:two-component system response regulator NreC
MTSRILVLDEHAMVRAGLCALLDLRPDMEAVGNTGDLGEALRLARTLQPDVVLTEIWPCNGACLSCLRRLKRLGIELHVLVVTANEDPDLAREVLQAGMDGYIPKHASGIELINAIRAVDRGELYVYPSLTRKLLHRAEPSFPTSCVIASEALTPRELDVLRLIAQGYTNREAAGLLTLSVRTVEGYRANLMDKLGIRSRAELVSYAFEHRLLQDEFVLA